MKDIVVVIDPGHGGENQGALYGDYIEKELTLQVAKAMKQELEQYEGVTCYLTRDTDVDISLEDRVALAEEVDADFFYCLHFNMSAEHTLYGAECWISAFGECYAKGYDFATIEMDMLTGTGLFDRGIKTRIGEKNKDYYGVIRHATEANIPSVIIEHCHLDHPNDQGFVNQDTWLTAYGRMDATAVAKHFGLKSETLGVDYSTLEKSKTPIPEEPVYPDKTAPEYCSANLLEINHVTGVATFSLVARDEDCRMLYYSYSMDGGESFTGFLPWESLTDEMEVSIVLPENQEVDIIFAADNLYNLKTMSEVIHIPAIEFVKEEAEETKEVDVYEEETIPTMVVTEMQVNSPKEGFSYLLWIEIAVLVFLLALSTYCMRWVNKNRKRKNKKR